MLETYALYSAELTDEERELGFELVEIQISDSEFPNEAGAIQAVAYRFSESDQIVKMNVPVIGGSSFRHERLRAKHSGEYHWTPAGSIVFPTAAQALDSLGNRVKQMQLCH